MSRLPAFAGTFAAALFAVSTFPSAAAAGVVEAAGVPQIAGVRDLGRAAPQTMVSLALTLTYRHDADLDSLIDAQSDPASPIFGHFVSNQQFNAYFAPTVADYARTLATLRRAGFTIEGTYDNRTLIDAVAPARVVERYFSTEIHSVQQTGYGLAYANVRPAILPAELSTTVDTVVGFDSLQKAHYLLQRAPVYAGIADKKIGGPLDGPKGGYGPLAIAQGFDFPVQHGFDGTGHAVANVAGNVADSDMKTFFKYFGIKRTGKLLRTMIQKPNGGANGEAALDVETMGSLDPGADVHLYILGNPVDKPGEDAYNSIVSDDTVDAVNSSFGVCENQDPTYGTAAQKIIRQGEAKGISWSASAGDGGSNGCGGGNQSLPAALPHVLGVGGTTLSVDSKGNYVSESAWRDGGGGISTTFALPNYQKGIKGLGSTTKRNVPDIAFPGDVQDAYYIQGQWGIVGGTSWSSPTSVALQAEINQMMKRRAGFSNPLIYGVFRKTQYEAFHDVTTGSNGFPAGPGYDNATGIGSIKGFILGGLE
jgi:kumamolisin